MNNALAVLAHSSNTNSFGLREMTLLSNRGKLFTVTANYLQVQNFPVSRVFEVPKDDIILALSDLGFETPKFVQNAHRVKDIMRQYFKDDWTFSSDRLDELDRRIKVAGNLLHDWMGDGCDRTVKCLQGEAERPLTRAELEKGWVARPFFAYDPDRMCCGCRAYFFLSLSDVNAREERKHQLFLLHHEDQQNVSTDAQKG